jgi:hypothetical protein
MSFPLGTNGATRKETLRVLREVNRGQSYLVSRVQHPRKVCSREANGGLVPNPSPDPMGTVVDLNGILLLLSTQELVIRQLRNDLGARRNALIEEAKKVDR